MALQLKKMSNKAKANRQRSMERSGSTERSSSVEKGSLSRQGSTEKPPAKEPDEGITEDLDPTELKVYSFHVFIISKFLSLLLGNGQGVILYSDLTLDTDLRRFPQKAYDLI